MATLSGKLDEFGIKAEVRGRPKHLWSIYEKMVIGGKEFDDIFDLVGLRVIVDEDRDCWAVIGAIHALWSPVPGRFKDYINSPKFNLYQSLHTTVIGPRGKSVEVQIRTFEMHRRAEFGVAAHWGYKEGASNKEVAWMQRLADVEEEENDPIAFLEALKLDLGQDEVYVFTPKGRVIALVEGATTDRLRLRRAHRGRPPLRRRQGQRPPRAPRHGPALGRRRRDRHQQERRRRSLARLARHRPVLARQVQDPPVVPARAPRGRHRGRSRGTDQGPASRGTADRHVALVERARRGHRGHEPRGPRRALHGHRQRSDLGARRRPATGPRTARRRRDRTDADHGHAHAAHQSHDAAQRRASTSRGSTT